MNRSLLTLILFVGLLSCGSNKKKLQSDVSLEKRFEKLIREVHSRGEELRFNLDSLTNFLWDTVIILKPYCSIDKVEKETKINLAAIKETKIVDDEVSNVLAFVNKGKLINYVDLPRKKGDFSRLNDNETIVDKLDAIFIIKEVHGNKKGSGSDYYIIEPLSFLEKNACIFKVKVKRTPTVWFENSKDFEILNSRRGITESSSAHDTNDCSGWSIKKENIKKIIQHSDLLSGPDWHYLFSVYPCIMTGQLKQDTNIYDFEINGGAWMYIYCKDTTILLGDFKKEDEKYFISGVWDGK